MIIKEAGPMSNHQNQNIEQKGLSNNNSNVARKPSGGHQPTPANGSVSNERSNSTNKPPKEDK